MASLGNHNLSTEVPFRPMSPVHFANTLNAVRESIMRAGNHVALHEYTASQPLFDGRSWIELSRGCGIPLKAFIARHVPEFFQLSYPAEARGKPFVSCTLDAGGKFPEARRLADHEGSPIRFGRPYRIETCMFWLTRNKCHLGDTCSFAHQLMVSPPATRSLLSPSSLASSSSPSPSPPCGFAAVDDEPGSPDQATSSAPSAPSSPRVSSVELEQELISLLRPLLLQSCSFTELGIHFASRRGATFDQLAGMGLSDFVRARTGIFNTSRTMVVLRGSEKIKNTQRTPSPAGVVQPPTTTVAAGSSSSSSSSSIAAETVTVPVSPPGVYLRTVRLNLHVPEVDQTMVVNADTIEELRTETLERLERKHPAITLSEPLLFTVIPPNSVGGREILTDEQLQRLAKNTEIWLLPLRVHVVVPGAASNPVVCHAYSLPGLLKQLDLADGAVLSASAPTAAMPSPTPITSWQEIVSLPSSAMLFAFWRPCVSLSVQRIINPQLDAEHGVCNICSRPFAHSAHLLL